MKNNRILFTAFAAIVFVAAAAAAIYVFRNEIADFLVDVKARIDEKILNHNSEYEEA